MILIKHLKKIYFFQSQEDNILEIRKYQINLREDRERELIACEGDSSMTQRSFSDDSHSSYSEATPIVNKID